MFTKPLTRGVTIFHGRRVRVTFRCSINTSAVVWEMKRDFRLNDRASCREASGRLFDLSYVTFSQSGGKTGRARSRFSSDNIMKSSEDEVREKEIAFLQGNFDNVRFSENYCFAVHKGEAESLTDLIDRYLSLNSTSFIQAEKHVKEKNHKRYSPNGK